MFDSESCDHVHVHNATRGCWAVRIDRQLETAVVNVRNSIDEIIEVDPGGKYSCVESLVARWHTEEEHFLARDVEKISQ